MFTIKDSKRTFDSLDALKAALKERIGDHLSVIETLPSGIIKPTFVTVTGDGTPINTYTKAPLWQ